MKKAEKTLESLQVVCFMIGKEEYGVEILRVQEILKIPEITKLPRSADYIMGVIDLRGRVLPIIDLGKRMGIEIAGKSDRQRTIVVQIMGKVVGLAIDSVSHVITIEAKDIEPPPPIVKGISGRYIVGIAKLKDSFVVILDIDKIFLVEEIKEM